MAPKDPYQLSYEATKKIDELKPKDYFSEPKHQRLQETWVAAQFGKGYYSTIGQCQIDIESWDDGREYDFFLVENDRRLPFQIAEVIQRGYRRGDYYKYPGQQNNPNLPPKSLIAAEKDGIRRIQEELSKKIKKNYSGAKSLNILLYYNVFAPKQRWTKLRAGTRNFRRSFASIWLVTDKYIFCAQGGERWKKVPGWREIQ